MPKKSVPCSCQYQRQTERIFAQNNPRKVMLDAETKATPALHYQRKKLVQLFLKHTIRARTGRPYRDASHICASRVSNKHLNKDSALAWWAWLHWKTENSCCSRGATNVCAAVHKKSQRGQTFL